MLVEGVLSWWPCLCIPPKLTPGLERQHGLGSLLLILVEVAPYGAGLPGTAGVWLCELETRRQFCCSVGPGLWVETCAERGFLPGTLSLAGAQLLAPLLTLTPNSDLCLENLPLSILSPVCRHLRGDGLEAQA